MTIRNLDALFRPKSVALIGASRKPGSVGNVVAHNLMNSDFEGPVMPVNPKAESIASTLAYPDVASLPVTPDLAVICTPPQTIPGLIAELGARGTRGAVVITAGFAEIGDEGRRLQQQLLEAAQPNLLRVVGPNCVGILVPPMGLNASFAHAVPGTGDLAFLSQSGAVITSVIDWATARGIGFSHMVSLGSMADVDFGDMLDYLAQDPKTRAVLLYVESVTNARKFMSAARACASVKPVIVMKSGRHAEGAKAAASHTGALAGSDAVYDAAFRRAGMLRVLGLDQLFDAAETLARVRERGRSQFFPAGPGAEAQTARLGILTNGGGIGVVATDWLIDEHGKLADLQDSTIEKLNKVLPTTWSHGNPVDIIGDAPGSRYADSMHAILEDEHVDAVLVLNCPTAVADSREAAHAVAEQAKKAHKPVFVNWLGDNNAAKVRDIFVDAGLPAYATPGQAVHAFMDVVRYRRNQALLLEAPERRADTKAEGVAEARKIVEKALAEDREWLSEPEAKAVLAGFGIPTVQTKVAKDADAAAKLADELGYPAAVKIVSPDITHKSDVGGVALNLDDADAVRRAAAEMHESISKSHPKAKLEGFAVQRMVKMNNPVELIAGIMDDRIFGPVVLFGHGGTAVEVLNDRAIGLPPLNPNLARNMIGRTRVSRLLEAYRDRPKSDVEGVADVLERLGELAAALGCVTELDINPLWAGPEGVVAVDARIRLRQGGDAQENGHDRFAIRPYPAALTHTIEDREGTQYRVRPVRPSDAALISKVAAEQIDPDDMRMRFLSPMRNLPALLTARLTQLDYDRSMAFIALPMEGEANTFAGVVRLSCDPDNERGEYAILVRSDLKGKGIGLALMKAIMDYGRERGLKEIYGDVLRENRRMLEMADELGFERRSLEDEPSLVEVVFKL